MAESGISTLDALETARVARCLFESLSDAILVFNAENLQILDANAPTESLTGQTREQLLRLRVTDCLDIADQSRLLAAGASPGSALAAPTSGCGRLLRKVGAPVDVHITINPVSNGPEPVAIAVVRRVACQQGEALPGLVAGRHVSGNDESPDVAGRTSPNRDGNEPAGGDRRILDHGHVLSHPSDAASPEVSPAARREIGMQNGVTSQFLIAIDNIHQALFVHDERGRIVDVNQAASQSLGYAREELLARKMSDIDPSLDGQNWTNRQETLKAEGRTLFESRHCRKDGSEFPVEVSTVHFKDDGREFWTALVKNISGRRKREAEGELQQWHLRVMDRVNEVLAGADEIQSMLDELMQVLLESLCCDRAYVVYPCDPGADEVSVRAERTVPEFPGALSAGGSLPVDARMAAVFTRLLDSSAPEDFRSRPMVDVVGPELADQYRVQSMMCQAMSPRIGRAWLLGVHQCSFKRVWTDAECRVMNEFSRRVEDRLSTLLTQRDLRRNQATLARAQQIARVGNWQRDLMTGTTTGSAEFLRILGIMSNEPPDSSGRFFENAVHPDDQGARIAAHQGFLATGQTRPLEYRLVVSGNTVVRYVREESELIPDQEGTPKLLVGTLQDVTAQKLTELALRESESKFRVLTENSPALVLIARDARLLYCNETVAAITGYSRAELSLLDFLNLIHPDHREMVAERHRARLASRNPPSRYEIAILKKDGSLRWVEISTSVIQYDGSAAALVVGIDHTEKRAAEDQLRERENQNAHVSRLSTMGEMVAGIAHELAQPLAAIANFAMASENTLKSDGYSPDAPVFSWLKQIGDQAFRCGDIIRGMRGFVKKSDGKRVRVQLHDVVRDSIVLISGTQRRVHSKITAELTGESPWLVANEVQLQQVLVNLLCNAGDATAECELPTIRIRVDRDDRRARIFVSDNGPGIDPRAREKLFDPFFTTKRDGMGMGLAISRSIVEAHGGTLRIDSAAAKGASFIVELPLMQSTSEK